MYLLGIDIGTSACKLCVFDYKGNVILQSSKGYKIYYPKKGYAEQNPNEWLDAVYSGIHDILKSIDSKDIKAIGIAGQSWSLIPIDINGDVLDNTPIWFDTRATTQCQWLIDTIGEDEIFNLCKNPIKPSYCTPKALWLKDNKREIYDNTYKFLQSNSFIGYKLTGVISQDKSQGYGHFFYDMVNSCYSDEMCNKMGLDIDKFPQIYNSYDIIGCITDSVSFETGLAAGTPVVAGGLDAACGSLGAGVYKNRQTQEQGGQAGGMSICLDEPIADKRLILGNHVVPNTWLLQGGTTGGGGAIKWFLEQFNISITAIDNLAENAPICSDGMIFLPYMAGERSPIWDPSAKGVYYGIDFSKTISHFARCTMEGVSFALLHNIEVAIENGAVIDKLFAMGGSANSNFWTQMKSDITGLPIDVPNSDNATTLGACLLAGIAINIYPNFSIAIETAISIKKSFYPNFTNQKMYQSNYKKYLTIYENLKGVMSE